MQEFIMSWTLSKQNNLSFPQTLILHYKKEKHIIINMQLQLYK